MISLRIEGDIAVITIDNPPVNAGSHAVRSGLVAALDEIDASPGIAGVILHGARKTFISGSDIREFGAPLLDPQLPQVIERIEALSVPVLAAIHGAALGGGLELALGCDYRLSTPDAQLALPEVSLGLVPGAGGTQRLPRLVGLPLALDLVVSSRRVSGHFALKCGLVDALLDGDIIQDAIAFLRANPHKRRVRDMGMSEDGLPDARAQLEKLLAKARRRPAAVQAADLVLSAPGSNFEDALFRERQTFQAIRVSPEAFAYRHVFFAEREAAKPANATEKASPAKRVAVIGAGTMGAGIAYALLKAGCIVQVVETTEETLATGLGRIRDLLATDLKSGRADSEAAERYRAALSGEVALSEIGEAELVIEAVFEDFAIKRDLLERLAESLPEACLIASNTSYLDLDRLVEGLRGPHRFFGLHFFSPAHVMKLLEIVRTEKTGDQTIAAAFALAKAMGKQPVLAKNAFGFIGNRVYAAYRRHAEFLLEDGASPEAVDAALVGQGMAMGPFAVADLSGLDIAWKMRQANAAGRDPAVRYVSIPDRLCEVGRFGRKTGAGYYDHATGAARPDPLVNEIIVEERRRKGIASRAVGAEEIWARCLGAIVNEAALLLGEGVARSPGDVDVTMIHGYGFPRWTGGPLWHSAHMEPAALEDMFDRVAVAEGSTFRRGDFDAVRRSLLNPSN